MSFDVLKAILPNRPVLSRIWRGPFRGARIVMNPRNSLRKIFGVYEHELNNWLDLAIRRVTRVLDIGANDGYFTFGCGAAFQRLRKAGDIIALESQARHVAILHESVLAQRASAVRFEIVQGFAGRERRPGVLTLDTLPCISNPAMRTHTLIKIDVEGAEVDVIQGASSWLQPTNLFIIEVHEARFIEPLLAIFAQHDLRLSLVGQRPLFLLGPEARDRDNCWLVSEIRAAT